jgi:hypothetical protein
MNRRASQFTRHGAAAVVHQEVQVTRPFTLLVLFALVVVGAALMLGGAARVAAAPAAQRALLDEDPPPIVDNFNRPDENPLSDGGKWSALASNLKVVSSRAACTIAQTCSMWRKDVRYGLDQDVMVTIEVKPINGDSVRLYTRLQKPTQFDGYALYLVSNAGVDQVGIERIDNGVFTALGTTLNQEFVPGDKLRLRAIGSTLEAWRYDNSAGSWSKLGERSDATYIGVGYVGLGMRGTAGRLDDFGAATLREPVPYADGDIIDNFNRPDENPLSDGGKYSVLSSNLKVVSNQVACTIAATCSMWRTDVRYGLDQDVTVAIVTKPENGNNVRLYARLQKPTLFDGYALYLQSNAGVDQVGIERWDNGSATTLGSPMNQEFLQGDRLRLRAIGSTLEAWRYDNNAGGWTKLGETSDATYVGIGYVGLGMRGTGGRLDDFGATTLRAPAPYADVGIIDNFNRNDENPLSDGGKYSVLSSNLKVVSHQVACTIAQTCSMWRTDVRYSADQEAWVTIDVKPIIGDSVRLYTRLQKPTEFDGYALFGSNMLGAIQADGRLVLNNGSHRAYALPRDNPDDRRVVLGEFLGQAGRDRPHGLLRIEGTLRAVPSPRASLPAAPHSTTAAARLGRASSPARAELASRPARGA